MQHVGVVSSWDPETGRGVVHDDAGGDLAVDRSGLGGAGDLEVGQTVEVRTGYDLDRGSITVEAVRALSDDEAFVQRLDWLCRSVDAAVEDSAAAAAGASDEDVEYRQGRVHEAAAREHERVPEIGRRAFEQGGEAKMEDVLSAVDERYRHRIAAAWHGIGTFDTDQRSTADRDGWRGSRAASAL